MTYRLLTNNYWEDFTSLKELMTTVDTFAIKDYHIQAKAGA